MPGARTTKQRGWAAELARSFLDEDDMAEPVEMEAQAEGSGGDGSPPHRIPVGFKLRQERAGQTNTKYGVAGFLQKAERLERCMGSALAGPMHPVH